MFKKYRNAAVGVITGFIIGSLLLIWPWKDQNYSYDSNGAYAVKLNEGTLEYRSGEIEEVKQGLGLGEELIVVGYKDWSLPDLSESSSWFAIIFAFLGFFIVFCIDRFGRVKPSND